MNAAIVNSTGIIINTIVVHNLTDPCPQNCLLVQISSGMAVDNRWKWLASKGFTNPNPLQVALPVVRR